MSASWGGQKLRREICAIVLASANLPTGWAGRLLALTILGAVIGSPCLLITRALGGLRIRGVQRPVPILDEAQLDAVFEVYGFRGSDAASSGQQ